MQISATYMRLLAREHPEPQKVLQAHGIEVGSARDTETYPVEEMFALVRKVDQAQSDRGWHLEFARRTADHFHGPLTFALMSAPTIGDGIEAFARYVVIRVPYLRGGIYRSGLNLSIELEELRDLEDLRSMLVEIPLRIIHDYVVMIGNVDLAAATLSLRYPASRERRYYRRGFKCRVAFDQERNALTLPATWMAIPNPQFDEGTWSSAVARCEVALAAMNPADTVTRTRAYINATLARDPGALSIDQAAQRLGMSTRTLIRRLGNGGTSFQILRDTARQDLALQMLEKPSLTVEAVSAALGFSDAANFSRAFKRWFGASPRRFRREHPG